MKSKNIAAMLAVAGGLTVVSAPATAGVPCGPSSFSSASNYSNTVERQQARAERKARKEARKAEKEARKQAKAEAKAKAKAEAEAKAAKAKTARSAAS